MTLPELKALAQAATPGPYTVELKHRSEYSDTADVWRVVASESMMHYLAALSPDFILRLIAAVEAADAMHANKHMAHTEYAIARAALEAK